MTPERIAALKEVCADWPAALELIEKFENSPAGMGPNVFITECVEYLEASLKARPIKAEERSKLDPLLYRTIAAATLLEMVYEQKMEGIDLSKPPH